MAEIEKWTLQQAKAIIAHAERTAGAHSNTNIDPARTKYNYALWPLEDPDHLILDTDIEGQSSARYAYARLKKRLSEVSCLQRNDVNVLCTWCVHLGADVPPGYKDKRAFFEATTQLLTRIYGAKNVVFAWVHEDEGGAHLHFGFVPVVRKEIKIRKNANPEKRAALEAAIANGQSVIERVDANALINRKHLQSWHGFVNRRLTEILGYDPAIYTGVTKWLGGNKTVASLKRTGPNWRKKRNAQVKAFHETRRAAKTGKQAGLEARMLVADPNRQKLQDAPQQQTRTGQKSIAELMQQAKDAGGRSTW